MTEQPLGKQLPRAKPVTMTFYDWLKTYPYSCTFYVGETVSIEDCQRLIQAISALSLCVLGKYSIGYHKFVIPRTEFETAFEKVTPFAMGTRKWLIKYYTETTLHSYSIPGINYALNLGVRYSGIGKQGRNPDPEHALWKAFTEVFMEVCVSKEGESITAIELGYSIASWPPKGWKKKNH